MFEAARRPRLSMFVHNYYSRLSKEIGFYLKF